MTELTQSEWPVNIAVQTPVVASQSCTVLSLDPDARRDPPGENVTVVTSLLWPTNAAVQTPVAASQSRTVWSQDPDARRVPSGEKVTEVIQLKWPFNVALQTPVVVSQSRTVLSLDPDARRAPSGERVTEMTPPDCPSKAVRREGQSESTPRMTLTPVLAELLYVVVNATLAGAKGRTDCHTC